MGCQKCGVIIEEQKVMLVQIDINNHNFSKIGKYISNKLHHIHKRQNKRHQTVPIDKISFSQRKDRLQVESQGKEEKKARTVRKKEQWYEPCVGTYRVNYSVVDKNLHLPNFGKSTPHFFNQKYKAQEVTPHTKEYPDGVLLRNKGHTELKRMVGREEIKGSIRKNQENPHEARFQTYQFPTLAFDSKGVSFQKMSERKNILESQRLNGADYDCDFEVKMKRLDSHIVPFQRQTNRPQSIFQKKNTSPQTYRYDVEDIRQSINKSVEWSKQIAREADGVLPGYLQKTVNSRMAASHANLKTLEMNCTDMKQKRKLPRKRLNAGEKGVLYSQTVRNE